MQLMQASIATKERLQVLFVEMAQLPCEEVLNPYGKLISDFLTSTFSFLDNLFWWAEGEMIGCG